MSVTHLDVNQNGCAKSLVKGNVLQNSVPMARQNSYTQFPRHKGTYREGKCTSEKSLQSQQGFSWAPALLLPNRSVLCRCVWINYVEELHKSAKILQCPNQILDTQTCPDVTGKLSNFWRTSCGLGMTKSITIWLCICKTVWASFPLVCLNAVLMLQGHLTFPKCACSAVSKGCICFSPFGADGVQHSLGCAPGRREWHLLWQQ